MVTLAEVGGVASYAAQLLPGLVEDFDLRVAAHGDGPLRSAAEALDIPYVPLRHMRRNLSPIDDLRAVAELYRLMRRERIDIVHAHSSKAGILARTAATLARVPVRLFTVHGWAFAAYEGVPSAAFRLADRAMQPFTTAVISPSAQVRDLGVAAGTCHPNKTVVIPNAVDTRRYPQALNHNQSPRILAIGRLAFPKDFSGLLQALGALNRPDIYTDIAGDGPERTALDGQIVSLGLEGTTTLLGTRNDIPELLAASDLFVLSSTSECLPMSIIEAMAAGLAVVATDVGGVAELVVEGETGLLVPAGDHSALADAIAQLLDAPDLRRRMGAAGRQRARELFDVGLLWERHVALYHRSLAGRRPASEQ